MAAVPEGDPAPLDGKLPKENFPVSAKPFSLYVHVPYCSSRCGYCDFNTYTPVELEIADQINTWTRTAVKEIEFARNIVDEDIEIDTIFFGGGTPSLLENTDLETFFNSLKNNFKLSKNIEITIEANPDTISESKVQAWLKSGINRVSIGMQSSVVNVLKTLDRTHNPENVQKSVEILKANNLNNFSLDLIYGTPGENILDWEKSIISALNLGPSHISAYSLVIEPGTKMGVDLKRGRIKPTQDDEMADKYLLAEKLFLQNGFDWYEISNWSKNNQNCRHNLNYWKSNNWWGIGPGAHSHINGIRWWNLKLPKMWREKLESNNSPALARETLTAEQISDEKIMLLIRLREGFDLNLISPEILKNLVEEDLVVRLNGSGVLTLKGRLLADMVFSQISG
jgi:oxygen-independent coproporphyrinogen-3 oxidase